MIDPAIKYIHNEQTHNLTDPSLLVPVFLEYFSPVSVCDVGCGIGNFLHLFKKHGVKKVLGFDGTWTNEELVGKYLMKEEFATIDFEDAFPESPQKFDLVLNLEVAEHVSECRSEDLIEFLTGMSDTIIFSAALPGQGGINHINERWEEYWEAIFNRKGFKKYDIIRHKIIGNQAISWWYRQNIVVYSSRDLSQFQNVSLANIILKENYINKLNIIINQSNFISQHINRH